MFATPPLAIAAPPAGHARVFPANLLFLTSLVLLITVGSVLQMWHAWLGLMGTELFLLLLPALLFARATRCPAAALRLRWVGMRPCCMGLAVGIGLFPLAAAAGSLGAKILGYTLDSAVWQTPTLAGTLVYLLSLVICAPFCEELVFHGYILAAYERAGWRPLTVILAVSALFAAFHLSPARFPMVGVMALGLTYVAWRTGSVWPGIAGHLGANATGALLTLTRHSPAGKGPGLPIVLTSILLTGAAAVCLLRIAYSPRPPQPEFAPEPAPRRQWWPIAVAALLILLAAAAEIATLRFHTLFARTPAQSFSHEIEVKPPWKQPGHWRYRISFAGQDIGEADYHLLDQGPAGTLLSGSATFRQPNTLTGRAMQLNFNAFWDRASMVLRRFSGKVTRGAEPEAFSYTEEAAQSGEPKFDGGLYSPYELPWRLSAAAMLQDRRHWHVVALQHRLQALLPAPGAGSPSELRITFGTQTEMVPTPAGSFSAVKLAVGLATTVWYDLLPPHTVVRYRNCGVEWLLVPTE